MSRTVDITERDGFFVGEDQALQFTVYEDDDVTVVNITGWTLQLKAALTEDGAALITKSATLTTPASGICTVSLAAADTSSLDPGRYYFTLSRTDSGFNQVVADGWMILRARPS
jgi:hypothetical protein